MPVGLNSVELFQYFRLPEQLFGKSIQPAWRFYATFIDNPFKSNATRNEIGPMPVIRSYHITSISLPEYAFASQVMMYGQVPRTFPTIDHRGFAFDVTFEEDENGTIAFFINWLQRSIIDEEGYYRNPLNNRVGNFVVEVQDKNGLPVMYYWFENIYFLNATGASYSYEENSQVKRTITFGVDLVKHIFTKYAGINAGQKFVTNRLTGNL